MEVKAGRPLLPDMMEDKMACYDIQVQIQARGSETFETTVVEQLTSGSALGGHISLLKNFVAVLGPREGQQRNQQMVSLLYLVM